MRSVCLALLLLAACKDKQEAKPTPAPATAAAPATQPPAPPAVPAARDEPATPTGSAARAPIKPAGGFTTAEQFEAKAEELTDQLTTVFEKAGTDCGKLADSLDKFAADHEHAIASTNAFQEANPGADEALEAKLQPKARKLVEKMSVSMQACQNNPRVNDAVARISK